MIDGAPNLGAAMRRRRKAKQLTLEVLAESSGVSVTMLSEVERGVKNPTVRLAYHIARALGCTLTDLLEDEERPPNNLVRAKGRRCLLDEESGVERFGLTHELMRPGVELVWYTIPSGSSAGEMVPNRPGVAEILTVLQGTLTLRLGDEVHEMGPRDTIAYGAQVMMEYRNEGDDPCEILLVCDRGGRP
ncbi:MAG: XRE family transcriptional regulator [Myxococcota bacterium]